MGFLDERCIFAVLSEDLIKNSTGFDCEHPDLNDFFLNDCVNYSKELLGKSYCFVLESDPSVIVCAFSISNDSIKTNYLTSSPKKAVNKSIPRKKHFRSYPAVLIGRLGVNKQFKKRGIGKELMDFIKAWFINPKNKTGCRFIVVDSYNEDAPIKYYLNNEFELLFSNEQTERNYTKDTRAELKTRLMYFDLIVLSSS